MLTVTIYYREYRGRIQRYQDAPIASKSREFTGLGPVDMIDD